RGGEGDRRGPGLRGKPRLVTSHQRALARESSTHGTQRATASNRALAGSGNEQHERDFALPGRKEEASVPRRRAIRELAIRAQPEEVSKTSAQRKPLQGRSSRQSQRDPKIPVEAVQEQIGAEDVKSSAVSDVDHGRQARERVRPH